MVREQQGSREEVKCQLERALEKEYQLVIVEPPWQGDHALRSVMMCHLLYDGDLFIHVGG